MWYHLCVLSISTLLWGCVFSEDCITPLGRSSKCISIYDCPDLLPAYEQEPIPIYILDFLKLSQCGFEDSTPKFCCGPIADEKQILNLTTPVKSTAKQNTKSVIRNSNKHFHEDTRPAPRGKCGINNIVHRIFEGNNTGIDEYPWMALLRYKTTKGKKKGSMDFKCGGALINHRFVLTAAHCIVGKYLKSRKLATVRLGEYDTSNDSEVDCQDGICADLPQEIPVASVYIHHKYNDTLDNSPHDIGIIKLAKRATYTNYVHPICLATGENKLMHGDIVHFSGWGSTLQGPSSPVKQKVQLPIVNATNCKAIYNRTGNKTAFIGPSQICAGGIFKQDGCDGDSGGPLMRETPEDFLEAVGVSAFSRGCGLQGYPGVYTSVAYHYGWIKLTLYSVVTKRKHKNNVKSSN